MRGEAMWDLSKLKGRRAETVARLDLEFDPWVITLRAFMASSEPLSKAEILEQLRSIMQELFELAPERVQLQARLVEDLELDSLDALDLAVKVEEITGHALEEAKLRQLRTVEDVIAAISELVSGRRAAAAER